LKSIGKKDFITMTRSVWKDRFIDVNVIRRFDELLDFATDSFKQQYPDKVEELEAFFQTTPILGLTEMLESEDPIYENFLEVLFMAQEMSEEDPIEVWSRRSHISSEFLGFCFLIYNGHVYKKIVVTDNMIGRKFGEFAITKRIGTNIHYPEKNKKKRKKKKKLEKQQMEKQTEKQQEKKVEKKGDKKK
jgi:small subunit ribosomal protein S19